MQILRYSNTWYCTVYFASYKTSVVLLCCYVALAILCLLYYTSCTAVPCTAVDIFYGTAVRYMHSTVSCTIPFYCTAVLYCCTALFYCTAVLYCIVLCCTVQYCGVLYCTVLHCTVLYSTVLLDCTAVSARQCTCTAVGMDNGGHAWQRFYYVLIRENGRPKHPNPNPNPIQSLCLGHSVPQSFSGVSGEVYSARSCCIRLPRS